LRTTAVLVPVKGSRLKSRLGRGLEEGKRDELAMVLLEHVMTELSRAGLTDRTYCITSGDKPAELARRFGAKVVEERSDMGVNAAVDAGIAAALGSEQVMVLPSDLPFLRAEDVQAAAAMMGRPAEVVLAPSAHFDGTNLLVMHRNSGMRLSYDRDSFWNHLKSASGQGLRLSVTTRTGFIRDLDSADDVRVVMESETPSAASEFLRRNWRV
jgi:2-phospho-L-lactate/phosphoenolpyruvate guanylyltransferase